MDNESLIALVKRYEFLYNVHHPKYMDTDKKIATWKEIGKQLKQPAVTCKHRWQSLRDSYRRVLKKRKYKTGLAASKVKQWRYEEEISFLTKYIVDRRAMASSKVTSDEESDYGVPTEIMPEDMSTEQSLDSIPTDQLDNNKEGEISNRISDIEKSSQPQNQNIQLSECTSTSASAVLMAHLLEETKKIPKVHDEMDNFFLSISSTVKKFSPYLQAVAKNKIFQIVSKMEIEQLTPPTCTASPPSTSPLVNWGLHQQTSIKNSPDNSDDEELVNK